MLADVILQALKLKLAELPGDSLGVRSRAIPTEGELVGARCLAACVEALAELKAKRVVGPGCFCVVASTESTSATLPEGVVVLAPDAAAAEATRIRNEVQKPPEGPLLVYLSMDSTPGEAGLADLRELTAADVVRSLADSDPETFGLLGELAASSSRLLVDRLRDCSVSELAEYARVVRRELKRNVPGKLAHLHALPLLGLLPRRVGDKPNARWVKDFESLIGPRLSRAAGRAAKTLKALSGEDRLAAAQQLRTKKALAVSGSVEAVDAATKLARAVASFARGSADDTAELCGLTSQLVREFRRGDKLLEKRERRAPSEHEAISEQELIELSEPAELVEGLQLEQDEEDTAYSVSLSSNGEDRKLTLSETHADPLIPWLIERTVDSAARLWLDGGAVECSSPEVVLGEQAPSGSANDVVIEALTDRGEDSDESQDQYTVLKNFLDARHDLLKTLGELAERAASSNDVTEDSHAEESSVSDDWSVALEGLLLLSRIPAIAVAGVRPQAKHYLSAYAELVACSPGLSARRLAWLTNLDLLFCADPNAPSLPFAARLLPLHPLQLARWLVLVEGGSIPPALPEILAVAWTESRPLLPFDRPGLYKRCGAQLRPADEGRELAVQVGVRDLWELLATSNLTGSLEIELRGCSRPERWLELIVEQLAERIAEDARHTGPLHLRVSLTGDTADLPNELPEELRSLLTTRPGAGELSIEICRDRDMPATRHLVLEEVPTPALPGGLEQEGAAFSGILQRRYSITAGGALSIELAGLDALERYQDMVRIWDIQPRRPLGNPDGQCDVSDTLVKVLVSRHGWPARRERFEANLFSYDWSNDHVAVSLAEPNALDAILLERLGGLALGEALTLGELRRGITRVRSSRSLLVQLIEQRDPRHIRAGLAMLRAYLAAAPELGQPGALAPLTLSMDTAEGRRFARLLALTFGGSESRPDLLMIVPDASGDVRELVAVELKDRTNSASAATQTARGRLAAQALLAVARLRALSGHENRQALMARDALRHLAWTGAAAQGELRKLETVLRALDRRLQSGSLPAVRAECWIGLGEPWSGPAELHEQHRLPAPDGESAEHSEDVRFVIVGPTEESSPEPEVEQGVDETGPEVSLDETSPTMTSAPQPSRPSPLQPRDRQESEERVADSPAASTQESSSSEHREEHREPSPVPQSAARAPERAAPPRSVLADGESSGEHESSPEPVADPRGGDSSTAPAGQDPEPAGEQRSSEPADEPPPEERPFLPGDGSNGLEIQVGHTLGTREPALWFPNRHDLVNHYNIGITGTMGTGKTQLVKSLLAQLLLFPEHNAGGRRPGLLIFDYKGDYIEGQRDRWAECVGARVLQPEDLPLNPIRPQLPQSRQQHVIMQREFAATIQTIVPRMGEVQRGQLLQGLRMAFERAGVDPRRRETWDRPAPTLHDLLEILREEDLAAGVPRAVISDLAELGIFAEEDPGTSLDDFFDGVHVINLKRLSGTPDVIKAVVAFFCNAFYARMIQRGEPRFEDRSASGGHTSLRPLVRLMLIDEADEFMKLGLTSLKNVMQQGRSFGHGVWLSTQYLRHFDQGSEPLRQLIGTWILHKMQGVELRELQSLFALERDMAASVARRINQLKQHESLCYGLSRPASRGAQLVNVRDLPYYELSSRLPCRS